MDKYWNEYGLLNVNPYTKYDENCLLYTAEHKLIYGLSIDNIITIAFGTLQSLCNIDTRMMNQIPYKTGTHEDYISHDQLLGIDALSGIYGKVIWEGMKRNFFTYDNVSGKFNIKRACHPRDIIYFGIRHGCKLWYLLAPLMLLMMLPSMKGPSTSGKILNWVRLKKLGWNRVLRFFNMISFYKNYEEAFRIYFPKEDHPLHQLAKETNV